MNTTHTLDEATRQGFIVTRGYSQLRSTFFRWCEKNNQPFVWVRLKTKYALVQVDLIAQTFDPSKSAALEIDALLTASNVGRRFFTGDFHTIASATRIPIAKAEEVASEIVAISARPGARVQSTMARGHRP